MLREEEKKKTGEKTHSRKYFPYHISCFEKFFPKYISCRNISKNSF